MRWLKKEYIGKVTRVTAIGYRHGEKVFSVEYYDGTEKEMNEEQVENLYRK